MITHANIFFFLSFILFVVIAKENLRWASWFSTSSTHLVIVLNQKIMSASNDLGQWYKSIPPITRTWFTASIIVPVATRLGLVRAQNLILFVQPVLKNFQVCIEIYLMEREYIRMTFYLDLAFVDVFSILSHGF